MGLRILIVLLSQGGIGAARNSRRQVVLAPARAGAFGVPLSRKQVWDEGEEPHHQQLHRRFDNPTTAVQENGTYGGQGKAAGCVPLAALLSLNFSHFVLAITS